jgi:hypothetical protein
MPIEGATLIRDADIADCIRRRRPSHRSSECRLELERDEPTHLPQPSKA